ncbi:ExbD/TolR family protein [Aquisphaera insulae]|uniref:ExbD/TolR family protein n=1 Tax=Aquisphaera insulae TaxID=2712864 RepID=UPI00202FA681|nr:biopolymer transporter ExbD [Aquisphaera insulae]
MPRSSRRSRSAGMISPNLTPLLDIVLQLITFFMMLVHFGTRLEGADRAVRLPVAPAALPGSDLTIDRLSVAMDRRGGLRVGSRVLGADETAAWWDEQARARRSGLELLQRGGGAAAEAASSSLGGDELPTVVILRADRDASYGAVRRTLAEAQERGFAQFSLVVLRREQP